MAGGTTRSGGRGRRCARAAAALAVAAGALLGAPGPAGAHAELLSSSPAAGEQLEAAPAEVVLEFTEAVDLAEEGVEVFDAEADAVAGVEVGHAPGDRATVVATLPDLPDGAYVVAWRIVSSDSHPISGAFTFAVGDAVAADAAGVAGDVESGAGADAVLGWVFGIDRFAAFAGVVVLVGGAAFVLALWPAGLGDRRARRLLAASWWVAFVATALGIALQGAYAAGGTLADVGDPGLVGDELGARVGRVWLARLALLLLAVPLARAATRRRQARRAAPGASGAEGLDGLDGLDGAEGPDRLDAEVAYGAGLLGVAILATVSLAGHAASGDLVPLALVTDVAHLAGVSAWLGGLALLAVAVLRPAGSGPDDADAADVAALDRVVGRYSTLAFGAVVVIVVSGVVQSWRQLGTFGALVDTPYGRLLLAKVVLFALMLVGAAASRNWVRARSAATAAGSSPAEPAEPAGAAVLSPGPGATAAGRHPDLARLRRSVGAEALIAAAVLAVTAGLVQAVPGETARSGGGAPSTFTTEMHGEDVLVEATVDPAARGPVTVAIRTLDHGGTPIAPEEVTATLTLPAEDLGPLAVDLTEEGTGTYRSSPTELPFAGDWELVVTVRTSEVDADRLTADVTVR